MHTRSGVLAALTAAATGVEVELLFASKGLAFGLCRAAHTGVRGPTCLLTAKAGECTCDRLPRLPCATRSSTSQADCCTDFEREQAAFAGTAG